LARKKTSTEITTNKIHSENASIELTQALGDAFGQIIERDFGNYIAPPPIITPTGIMPLDYLLGGGLVSSKPIMISSTPETGKSTFCFQISKAFQACHENGVVVYLDIEGAGNLKQSEDFNIISRIETFGLNNKSFQYQPVILTIGGVFEMIEKLAAIKQAFEDKLQKEFYVMIIWDSLSATRSARTDVVEDVNQQIGYKARELTFKLEKFSPLISFRRFTLVIVDQVRANLKDAIEGVYALKEKSVGNFNDYRAATSINSLNHLTGQWLYFSKKKLITVADGMGIDGWYINITTEKNKYAPSQYTVTCVFDKINGIDKFWSEYTFLSELCPSENKIYKKEEKKLPYPLVIKQVATQVKLMVFEETATDSIIYESVKMYRKDIKHYYNTNNEFHQWFDYAVEISVKHRIIDGLFKCQSIDYVEEEQQDVIVSDFVIPTQQEPETYTEQEPDDQDPNMTDSGEYPNLL